MRTIRIRLALKPRVGRYAAPLAMVMAIPVIGQTLRVNAFFPAPYAQYGRLITTGPSHTLLARFAGNVGIGTNPANAAPAAPLTVQGTVHVQTANPNAAPPALPPVLPGGIDSLSVSGSEAGVSMQGAANGGTNVWAVFDAGGIFNFWNNWNGSVVTVWPGGNWHQCQWTGYGVGPGGTPCSTPGYHVWFANGRIVDDSPWGQAGLMLCCNYWP